MSTTTCRIGRTARVTRTDGRVVVGMIANETETTVTVLTGRNTDWPEVIGRSDIDALDIDQ